MTDDERKIVDALERGLASGDEQKEAARIIRDLDSEVRELSEFNQRG